MITIHRKVPSLTIIAGVKFFPGMNPISDGEFKKVKEHKNQKGICAFDEEVECGNMVIGGKYETITGDAAGEVDDVKARAGKLVSEVASMNVRDAKELIAETGDGYLLRELKKSDGRKGVQEAVDKRMEEIEHQVGSDLAPESKAAPGNGSDFDSKITGSRQDLSGTRGHSDVPALGKNK